MTPEISGTRCVYTIVGIAVIETALKNGGKGELTEGTPWTSARKHLDSVADGGRYPLLLANAATIAGAQWAATIDDIVIAQGHTRVVDHNKQKEFWNRALVVVSLTNSLTQTHSLYLEWLSIKQANEAGRFNVENGNSGSKPHTPAPLEADCLELFDTLRTLVATLGQPVFESLAKARELVPQDDLFFCKTASRAGIRVRSQFHHWRGLLPENDGAPLQLRADSRRTCRN